MISAQPTTGTGMLAVFCDLETKWHREFREWLRDDMIPARMKIGFRAAASFDLIAGAAENHGDAEPFVTAYETASIGDLYGAPYQALRAGRDQRDKDFHARFIRPSRYTLSWVGPTLDRGAGAPPASADSTRGFTTVVVFDRIDLPEAAVQDFNLWYMTRYLPRFQPLSGLRSLRRYLAMEGSPRHVLIHDLENAAALSDPRWREARAELGETLSKATARTSGAYECRIGIVNAP